MTEKFYQLLFFVCVFRYANYWVNIRASFGRWVVFKETAGMEVTIG
jgi:hypothetical protein